ncbi:MAG: hypothetical protein LAO18_19685 [Acidobacteriia bacterium]|nr:hypothetical protein [Terriglobia bacterium]
MQPWDALQRELLPRGFHAAIYAAINCRDHGLFRAALAHGTTRCPCPTCERLCRPRFLALGLTRRPLPVIEACNELMKPPVHAHYVKLTIPTRSKFEREVRRRRLKLDDQESLVNCAPLKAWVEKHRFRAYVPTELLTAWRLSVPEARVPDIALD